MKLFRKRKNKPTIGRPTPVLGFFCIYSFINFETKINTYDQINVKWNCNICREDVIYLLINSLVVTWFDAGTCICIYLSTLMRPEWIPRKLDWIVEK